MVLVLLIALLLLTSAAVLTLRAVMLPRLRAKGQLAQIDAYGFAGGAAPVADPALGDPSTPIGRLGDALGQRIGRSGLAKQRKMLMQAGMYDVSPERFLGYKLVAALGLPLLTLWALTSAGIGGIIAIVAMAWSILAGLRGPDVLLQRRGRQRMDAVDKGMPELVDLLVVGVESGMGFNGAMRTASSRVIGPLGDELRLMLQEQSLGASSQDALRNMLDRADTPATRSFVRTIIQGERLGVSIGHLMRSLAEEMRKRRKSLAEEAAHKAPIKILFPLVFLIFPAIFIVILTPAAINVVDVFK